MRQNHTVNIVFPGNFEDLLSYLESKGVEFDFVLPGLKDSQSVLEVYPTDYITTPMTWESNDPEKIEEIAKKIRLLRKLQGELK